MRALGLLVAWVLASWVGATETATSPLSRMERVEWAELHQRYVAQAKERNRIALFGDSITFHMQEHKVWSEHLKPLGAANFGIRGDRTGHLLWRLMNGELDEPPPAVAVLLIGTNNLAFHSNDHIAEGIERVVNEIRKRAPESKVLVLGLLPRERFPSESFRVRAASINAQLAALESKPVVRFMDIGNHFLADDGSLKGFADDYLHLIEEGYEILGHAIMPMLKDMLGEARPHLRLRRQ